MMRYRILSWLLIVCFLPFFASAKKVLDDLDFSKGKWEVVGVSLHNYVLLPIQKEMGCFVIKDMEAMKTMQQTWDFEQMFDDYCDYHYALKFYQNGKLIKTLRINLFCNYISDGGLSYHFKLNFLTEYRNLHQRLYLSRINFKSIERLRKAIDILYTTPDVYFYHDPSHYKYDGFFMIGEDNLPWNVNRDSVLQSVRERVSRVCETQDFYLKQYVYFIEKGIQSIRYEVYCSEKIAKKYPERGVLAPWRNHFAYTDVIQMVIVGINKSQYFDMMGDK